MVSVLSIFGIIFNKFEIIYLSHAIIGVLQIIFSQYLFKGKRWAWIASVILQSFLSIPFFTVTFALLIHLMRAGLSFTSVAGVIISLTYLIWVVPLVLLLFDLKYYLHGKKTIF